MSINFFSKTIKKEGLVDYITTDLTKNYPYKLLDVKEFKKMVTSKSKELDMDFLDEEDTVLVILQNKENNLQKYLELRKIDYSFMEEIAKLLKTMNLLIKFIGITEKEIHFTERYRGCIYSLQRITDYIYFKQILQLSYDKIPTNVLESLNIKRVS